MPEKSPEHPLTWSCRVAVEETSCRKSMDQVKLISRHHQSVHCENSRMSGPGHELSNLCATCMTCYWRITLSRLSMPTYNRLQILQNFGQMLSSKRFVWDPTYHLEYLGLPLDTYQIQVFLPLGGEKGGVSLVSKLEFPCLRALFSTL